MKFGGGPPAVPAFVDLRSQWVIVEEIRLGPQIPPIKVLSPTHRGKLRVAGEVAQSSLAAWVVGGA